MGRDHSMDLIEPQWSTNSSFSPPPTPSRIWDCRIQTDNLLNGPGDSVHGTSASSNDKVSRRGLGSDRYSNHQHSVSDGNLSYSGSPPDNVQVPRWTSPIQKINFDSFATPAIRGSRCETAWLHSTERQYAAGPSVPSCSYGSPSSLTESRPWESSGKQPSPLFGSRNFSSRRSFISKPVYPLVIHKAMSDCETIGDADTCSIGRLTPGKDMILPSNWPDISTNIEHKFHKTLTELPKMDTSTDPSSSSRREGFRWSSASSYDMGFDGENFNLSENIDLGSLRSPNYHTTGDQKCGVCAKFLWQKSPWGSNGIMRSGDLPIAGILPCSHVFHAECLEQVTPKPQIQDPPCPLCLKTIGLSEDSPPVSEPLMMALRSVRQRRGVMTSDARANSSIDEVFNYMKDSTKKISSSSRSRQKGSHSLVTTQFKRHLSFKGRIAKDFFSTKVFRKARSSSSIREPVQI